MRGLMKVLKHEAEVWDDVGALSWIQAMIVSLWKRSNMKTEMWVEWGY